MEKKLQILRHSVNKIFACLLAVLVFTACKSTEQSISYSEILKSVLSESDILMSQSILYPSSYEVNIEEIEKNSMEIILSPNSRLVNKVGIVDWRYLISPVSISHLKSQVGQRMEWADVEGLSTEFNIKSYLSISDKTGNTLYSVSKPLFYPNKKYALLYISKSSGIDSGSGSILMLKKEGDDWILLGSFSQWIS